MAIEFDEVLLDSEYGARARGGPEFSTAVITAVSGVRQRNANRLDFIGRWAIAYDVLTPDSLYDLYKFFVCRQGMAYGFRFLAPEAHSVPSTAAEQFGTGNGVTTTFQLQRQWTSGPRTYTKKIIKPMAGGLTYVSGASEVKIYDNGTEVTSGVSVSSTTGVVTFTIPPTNTHILTWSGTYHTPVMFGRDAFESEIDIGSTSLWGVDIIEILPQELGL
jgi:uncharacterized protein (TIGR02217 family)